MSFIDQESRNRRIGKLSDKTTRWIGSPNSVTVHTIFFVTMIVLALTRHDADKIMLTLTTIVSLEAIYLSIFIQMTVNKHSENLEEVSEDIEEIQENVEDIQEDVEDLGEIEEEVAMENIVSLTKQQEEELYVKRIEQTLGELVREVNELKQRIK